MCVECRDSTSLLTLLPLAWRHTPLMGPQGQLRAENRQAPSLLCRKQRTDQIRSARSACLQRNSKSANAGHRYTTKCTLYGSFCVHNPHTFSSMSGEHFHLWERKTLSQRNSINHPVSVSAKLNVWFITEHQNENVWLRMKLIWIYCSLLHNVFQ